MKQLIILSMFMCLGFGNQKIHSQTYFTVLAESGLSIRKEASIESEKLDVVPFLKRVELIEIHKEKRIKIEEVNGFWVEVQFNDIRGFMFSGYLSPREYPSLPDNQDFILLDEYEDEYEDVENGTIGALDFTKYRENVRWFGVKIMEKETIFEEVQFELYINPRSIQKMYDRIDYPLQHPLADSVARLHVVNDTLNYNFFIGSSEKIDNIINSRVFFKTNDDYPGDFVSPFQPIKLLNRQYLQSEILVDKEDCLASYEIFILNDKYQRSSDLKWNELSSRNIKDHLSYQSPRIIWEGDINGDKAVDFIFYVSPMEDKCVRSYHKIYISKKNEFGQIVYDDYFGINLSSMNYWK